MISAQSGSSGIPRLFGRGAWCSSDSISGANSISCRTPPESIHWQRTWPLCVIAFTVIRGLPEFNTTMFPTMSGIADPHFPLPLGLDGTPKEETTGAPFGFSFSGFFFSRLLFCSRLAIARSGRTIGIYPETKHATFHRAIGLPLEDRLLDILREVGWTEKSSPVIIQSMEPASLKYLRARTNVRLMQLISGSDVDKDGRVVLVPPDAQPYDFVVSGDKRTFQDLVTKAGLAEIKTYADGIGVWKPYLLPSQQLDRNGDGKPDDLNGDGVMDERDRVLLPPTHLVTDAHTARLFVHAWTFRNEPRRLISDFGGDPAKEYKAFYVLGVDGVFSDFPDTAVKAR